MASQSIDINTTGTCKIVSANIPIFTEARWTTMTVMPSLHRLKSSTTPRLAPLPRPATSLHLPTTKSTNNQKPYRLPPNPLHHVRKLTKYLNNNLNPHQIHRSLHPANYKRPLPTSQSGRTSQPRRDEKTSMRNQLYQPPCQVDFRNKICKIRQLTLF